MDTKMASSKKKRQRKKTSAYRSLTRNAKLHLAKWSKEFFQTQPRLGALRRSTMKVVKSLVRPRTRRPLSLVLAGFALVALAACGGGGGSSTPTPPVATPTPPVANPPTTPVSPAPPAGPSGVIGDRTNCSTAVDQSSCEARVKIALAGVANPTLVVGEGATATTITLSGSGGEISVPLSGPPGERKLVLKAGDGTVLDGAAGDKTVSKSCVAESSADSEVKWVPEAGKCIMVHYYARTAYVFSDEAFTTVKPDGTPGPIAVGWPQELRGLTATPLKNGTGVQATGCGGSVTKLWNGLPAAACTIRAEGNRRAFFPIDVKAGVVLPEYVGPLPTDFVWYTSQYGALGDSPYSAQGVSSLGSFAVVPGAIYFAPDSNANLLMRTTDNFATAELIKEGYTNRLFIAHENQRPTPAN